MVVMLHLQIQDYIKFSLHELEIFCKKFQEEESKEEEKIKKRLVILDFDYQDRFRVGGYIQ